MGASREQDSIKDPAGPHEGAFVGPWPPEFRAGWDPEAQLWTETDEYGRCVHPTRETSQRLLLLAVSGHLGGRPEIFGALRALRATQARDGENRGIFKWNAEDDGWYDSNASFFNALPLIALEWLYADRLGVAERALLRTMLVEVRLAFRAELVQPRYCYPNKCLGDLVCAWLLAEAAGEAPSGWLLTRMEEGARYYWEAAWGWGEHLSDLYAKVIQDELVLLLALSRTLPAGLRTAYAGLLAELNDLDAVFHGGPRVPAIRSYQFERSPLAGGTRDLWSRAYAELLTGWRDAFGNGGALRALAGARGWVVESPKWRPEATDREVNVPCHGGATALASICGDLRIGALTRYPLMADTDQPTWGLAWQSMPVAMAHAAGDWGFLQWEAVEVGVARAFPAHRRVQPERFLLSYADPGLAQPQTHAMRLGEGFAILRRMPEFGSQWSEVCDRLRLIESMGAVPVSDEAGGWRRLRLEWAGAALTWLYCPLGYEAVTELVRSEARRGYDWEHRLALTTARRRKNGVAGIWVALPGCDPLLPALTRVGERWIVKSESLRIEIDPAAPESLRATL